MAERPINILLQTTIPPTDDDWHIGRFTLLREHLSKLTDGQGRPLYQVTARDRAVNKAQDDPVLSTLDQSDFDELWLFAVDAGEGLTKKDCEGITRFRQRGGGVLATRDHQDLGSSLCSLGGLGKAHHFHSQQPDPDQQRCARDDTQTQNIDWPNYHSGANGDYQRITPCAPLHELLRRPDQGQIELFPAHPHEGSVGAPGDQPQARVVAQGKSLISNRDFNLIVAFERASDEYGHQLGRGVAESSFHHFADYNWDVSAGAPSFVAEAPGQGYQREPRALEDIKVYAANLARWLAPTVT